MDDKTVNDKLDKLQNSIDQLAHKWLMPLVTKVDNMETKMDTMQTKMDTMQIDVAELKDGQKKYDQILKKQEIRIHAVEDVIKIKCE